MASEISAKERRIDERRIDELEKQVKAQQEEIDAIKRQVERLLHPYAQANPRIVDLSK